MNTKAGLEEYIESLGPNLKSLGLAALSYRCVDGQLSLTPQPLEALPIGLDIVAVVAGERYFKSNGLIGVVHGKPSEGLVVPIGKLDALVDLLLQYATPELVLALGPRRTKDSRLWNLSMSDLVARGLRPAAIVNIEDKQELMDQIHARVPAAIPSIYAYRRNELGHLKWIKDAGPSTAMGSGTGHRLMYCAQSLEMATLLRDLDWLVYIARRRPNTELQTRIGVLLGYPECCSAAYEREIADETEPEDVRWIRAYEKAANETTDPRRTTQDGSAIITSPSRSGSGKNERPIDLFSPWTNLVAARMAHMLFFEHLPCSPWCHATEVQNRRMVKALFGESSDAWILSILSVSFFCWPDGRLVPFRCGKVEGNVTAIRDVGTAWTEGVVEHHGKRLVSSVGLLPVTDPTQIRALRTTSGGWDILAHGKWHSIGTGKSAPLVLPFADS